MGSKKKANGNKSLWEKLDTKVKVIGAVILGISTTIGIVQGVITLYSKISVKPVEKCAKLEVRTFPKFPYYLVNTCKKAPQNDYIYWAMLDGKNDCSDPLNIKIIFKVNNKQVAEATIEEFDTRISPGQSIRKNIDPEFRFLRDEPEAKLKVTWKIIDVNTNKIINQDFRDIDVISKSYMYWDLKNSEGKEVSLDFLLASLSAWSLKPAYPQETIRERAMQYLQEIPHEGNSSQSQFEWFKRCYSDLFHGPHRLNVSPHLEPWPPKGKGDESKQRIRDPFQTLNSNRLDSLEAALLISTLTKPISKIMKFRLIFMVLSKRQEGSMGPNQFLLSWLNGSGNWHAFDVTNPNSISFEENEREITLKLNDLLRTEGGILPALSSKGVFIDEKRSILALDFDKASRSFQIGALP